MSVRKIIVFGALGNVGREMISVLAESKVFNNPKQFIVIPCARPENLGQKVSFGEDGDTLRCDVLEKITLQKGDIVLGASGSEAIAEVASKITSSGAFLIDNSPLFRMDNDVPLVIPEINGDQIGSAKRGIIANPNCSVIQMLLPLKDLHAKYKIKRIVISTYQAVSGAGKEAMNELFDQTKQIIQGSINVPIKVFPKRIAFNCIPQVDVFTDDLEDGRTKEEVKIEKETKKILDASIEVCATCVRVPVFHCHAESVNVEFENSFEMQEVIKIVSATQGVTLNPREEDFKSKYYTQIGVAKTNDVFVSRLRKDNTAPNAINMWVVADNLRKGAALNAIQIAEEYISKS